MNSGGTGILNVRFLGLIEKVTFEKIPEENEGISPVCIWRENIPERDNDYYKGPTGSLTVCFRSSNTARDSGVQEMRWKR